MIFQKYTGSDTEVSVAAKKSGEEITAIGVKAFLSCKSIKKLEIGGSVTEIGDWAFAHMRNLEQLVLPCRELKLGRKVFLGCEELRQIQIDGDESQNPGTPFLLASAVRVLKKEELCRPNEAGDALRHEAWLRDYDGALLSFLDAPDEAGFEPVFIGWFKVDDIDDQLPGYLAKRRKEKAQLVLQRLLYPAYLQENVKNKLYQYIEEHVPKEPWEKESVSGGEYAKEHTAVFGLLCEEEAYSRNLSYFKIIRQCGCLSVYLAERFLEEIKMPVPEVTAFLLREKAEKDTRNFFESFDF